MRNLSVYVHIPFCVKKCDYCDFLSAPADENTKTEYVDRLLNEIQNEAENYRNYSVVSVFFGGGTPSVLKIEDTERILSVLQRNFHIVKEAEITSEVNPKTADYAKLKEYKRMGFNRLSIGLQSALDEELKLLGRIHNYRDFLEIYEAARRAGFENINVDLMSALPGQTLENYKKSVESVLALKPEHISAYSLILEEGTPFFEQYEETEEELDREMYLLTGKLLENSGYHRYEISNYAKNGYECRHNKAYWERQDYIGFGIGAASLIENRRFKNLSDLTSYLAGSTEKEECFILTEKECMEEFMFLGLRLIQGVSKKEFLEQFGTEIEKVYGNVIESMEKQGLLLNGKERVCLTCRGLDVSNYVMAGFLLDD